MVLIETRDSQFLASPSLPNLSDAPGHTAEPTRPFVAYCDFSSSYRAGGGRRDHLVIGGKDSGRRSIDVRSILELSVIIAARLDLAIVHVVEFIPLPSNSNDGGDKPIPFRPGLTILKVKWGGGRLPARCKHSKIALTSSSFSLFDVVIFICYRLSAARPSDGTRDGQALLFCRRGRSCPI